MARSPVATVAPVRVARRATLIVRDAPATCALTAGDPLDVPTGDEDPDPEEDPPKTAPTSDVAALTVFEIGLPEAEADDDPLEAVLVVAAFVLVTPLSLYELKSLMHG